MSSDNKGSGAAWVFTRAGATWAQQGAKLTVKDKHNFFGFAVALSGDGRTGLIGGYDDNDQIGAAWIFSNALSGVQAWGFNPNGALGDGTNKTSALPVSASELSGVKALAGGGYHSLALMNDGTVMAWGQNDYGELGDGTRTNKLLPVHVTGLQNVIAVSAGQFYSLALLNDGTMMAWGRNGYGELGYGSSSGPNHVNTPPTSRDAA